jgi:ABC-type nitrate/sulfonate/bicarbonate transport system permease component
MTAVPAGPPSFRSRRRLTAVRLWTLRVAAVAVLLGFWQWYGTNPDHYAVAPPTKVFPDLWTAVIHGPLVHAMLGTLAFMMVGLLIAAVLGIGGGLLIAVSDVADNTLTPLVNAAYAAPISLLIPIVGVYTGVDFWGRVFLVVAFAVWVILINTEAGVRSVPDDLLETAEAFCLNRRQLVRHVIAPSTLPYIMTGLRLGVGRAFRGAIVADLLLAVAHIGAVLVNAGSTFNSVRLLSGILFTTMVGYALMAAVEFAERRAMPWRQA